MIDLDNHQENQNDAPNSGNIIPLQPEASEAAGGGGGAEEEVKQEVM